MKKQEVFPMKKCKRCGALLEENVTICPHCGIENPVQPEKKKTAYDLTIAFDPMAQGSSLYRVKSRKKLLVFSFLLAFLGVPYFYIEKAKKGWISLSIFFILGGLSSLIRKYPRRFQSRLVSMRSIRLLSPRRGTCRRDAIREG